MSPKKLADPGKVVRGFELLQEMAGHAKVSMGGLDSNYKKAVNKLASITIARLLFGELQWFSRNGARIVITYSKPGVWGDGKRDRSDIGRMANLRPAFVVRLFVPKGTQLINIGPAPFLF